MPTNSFNVVRTRIDQFGVVQPNIQKVQGAENVNHIYYMVNAKDKYLALKRIVDFYPRIYGIVFCRTKAETQEVADKLIRDGYNAEPLHGDLSQQQRDITMQKFRQHITQLLVATDVARAVEDGPAQFVSRGEGGEFAREFLGIECLWAVGREGLAVRVELVRLPLESLEPEALEGQ